MTVVAEHGTAGVGGEHQVEIAVRVEICHRDVGALTVRPGRQLRGGDIDEEAPPVVLVQHAVLRMREVVVHHDQVESPVAVEITQRIAPG